MRLLSRLDLIILTAAIVTLSCCGDNDRPVATPATKEHVAITTEKLEPYECGSISRLHTYKGVFLASQPQPADFEQAKKGGVKTVINLRHPEEIADFDEAGVISDLGLTYHNPAWNGPEELTDEVFGEVRDLLRTAERSILLHCSSGNRVGAMWMAYRSLDENLAIDEAVNEAKIVGMKSPEFEKIAKDYVERNKAQVSASVAMRIKRS
jgi:uncharacterized protein (TIGR01244 family)